ncbi:MAG: bifunctional phosphopantothenoylcysteine decarboxylase/phosphopantothenate--cysteine ligase CoaBC [Verrucomicrobia bacterium]|nr:bifunctional phosphopantothenoylcysteine decarboxylase/phosphopantothenate--cysteine ligase CoaBC [Verrucomicrobiota bacterium]
MSPSNLVVIVTGSVAAFRACDVVSQLVQRGHRVRVVTTAAARQFVGTVTWEALSGQPVAGDLFDPGAALDHIHLGRWADLVLVCPATANTLNRLAVGLADDLAGALFLARDSAQPWLIAPAMNPAMWSHPATRQAVERLESWGVSFLPVAQGRTACGETGEGRLAPPPDIVAAVEQRLTRPKRRWRVLVTSGGTVEPIDPVRVLGNTSTGRTGAAIADHFARSGHDVVLLRARTSEPAASGCAEETFETYSELAATLERLLGEREFDVVIHAAAVSDFRVAAVEVEGGRVGNGKLPSDTRPVLRLEPTPKLADRIRAHCRNPEVCLVAFKLTHGADESAAAAAVTQLLERSGADFVVHNDLTARTEADTFPASIHDRTGAVVVSAVARPALPATLERVIAARLSVSPNPNS